MNLKFIIKIMRIPEQKIDEIRNSADIVDIISGHVQLKKRGKNFVGLCPFHQEKTPSFTVSEDKQIYHCFGCGNGGNIFKFLMEFKNISFVEAVEEIADNLGIKIQYDKSQQDEQQSELEELYEINVFAARFFLENLLKTSEGEEARNYLKSRKIKTQTERTFGLGFAPFNWDNFLLHAKQNKLDLQKAKHLGLIDVNEKGDFYDKFRNRIIFPIFSPNGRVIAFGGRTLESRDDIAKYLNSPESKIYSKRRSLYGLYHSKDEIRKLDRAILVEGYMDLIALFQSGVKNVVASSGTSLTDEQVQLLSRFTKNIIIIFDADPAGQKASLRSIEIILKQNFDVKVIALPSGEDPDSFINKYGKEKFDEMISNSKNFLEYQTEQFEIEGKFDDPAEGAEAIRELVKTLSLVDDELKRSLLLKSISKKFSLREKLIESELNNFLEQLNQRTVNADKGQQRQIKIPTELSSSSIVKSDNPFEREITRLLYSGDEEIMGYIFDRVSSNLFSNQKLKILFETALNGFNENQYSPSFFIEKIEDEELKSFVLKLTLTDEVISKKWDEISYNGKIEKDTIEYAQHTVTNFLVHQIEQQIKLNNKIIEESKDERLHIELLKRNQELQEEKKSLASAQNGN
ncbi:MAG: DNA primase [Ignavibacteria bacterium]|nr:DNA primase [Ignavibacteria bacterium]